MNWDQGVRTYWKLKLFLGGVFLFLFFALYLCLLHLRPIKANFSRCVKEGYVHGVVFLIVAYELFLLRAPSSFLWYPLRPLPNSQRSMWNIIPNQTSTFPLPKLDFIFRQGFFEVAVGRQCFPCQVLQLSLPIIIGIYQRKSSRKFKWLLWVWKNFKDKNQAFCIQSLSAHTHSFGSGGKQKSWGRQVCKWENHNE